MMGAGPVRGTAEMGPKPGGNSVRVNRACGGRGGGGNTGQAGTPSESAGFVGQHTRSLAQGRREVSVHMQCAHNLQAQAHTAASPGPTLKGGCSGFTFG